MPRSLRKSPSRPRSAKDGPSTAYLDALIERLGLASEPPGENTYHAFISYSHAVDGALAPALQRGLQRFAKPWYKLRSVRVFRDEASLSANPGLWSSIEQALDDSLFFILLASPGAAASPWVTREAARWRATKSTRNLLIGLTDGDLVWDSSADDFDWAQTTALPESLHGAFAEEPRFIDLRWAHSDEQLSLSHARFRDAVAELAAPLHGVPKDVLAGEEVRQHRRTVRIARTAAVSLAILTLASVLFGVFALLQRNEARRQRDIATSRALVQAASASLDTAIDRAGLLSLEAFRIRPNAETRSSLIRAVQRTEHIVGLHHVDQPVERIAFDAAQRRLAAAGTRSVVLWSLDNPRHVAGTIPVSGARALAFSPGGKLVAVGGRSALSLWVLGPHPRRERRIAVGAAKAIAFSRDGRRVAVVGPDDLSVFGTKNGARLRHRVLGMDVSAAAFASDETHVAIGGPRTLMIVDLTTRRPPLRIPAPQTPLSIAFDPQRTRVAAVDLGGDGVTVWDPSTGDVLNRIRLLDAAQTVGFAPDGRIILGMNDGTVALRSLDGSAPPQVLRGPEEKVFDIAFPDHGRLATSGEQGDIVLWDPAGSALRRELARLLDPISDADFSSDAKTLAVGGLGDLVTLWSFNHGRVLRRTIRSGSATAVAVDSAGTRVAVGDGGVVLYRADGGRQRLQPRGTAVVEALEFSTADVVGWGTRGRIALWDAAKSRRLEPLPLDAPLRGLAFGDGGKSLVVAEGNRLTLWDLRHHRSTELMRGQATSSVATTRSGRLVAAATPDRVVAMDANGRQRFVVPLPQGVSVKLAWSPDESTLAVGTSDARLLFVDARAGQILGTPWSVPGGPVSGLDFSADGGTLATATQGGVVTLWDDLLWEDVDAMKQRLCAVAGRSLSRREWREFIPGKPYHATCR